MGRPLNEQAPERFRSLRGSTSKVAAARPKIAFQPVFFKRLSGSIGRQMRGLLLDARTLLSGWRISPLSCGRRYDDL